jgi:hypothetical protein
MYKLGSPIKVQIDDRLPMTTGSKLLYAQKGEDKSLWGPLLEKAFAKLYGNYEVLILGRAGNAMSDMTGGPFIRETDFSAKSDDDLWQMVKNYDE